MEKQKGIVSKVVILAITIAVVVGILFVVAFYLRQSLTNTPKPTESTGQTTKKDETTVTTAASVSLTSNGFVPQAIRVKRGSQVTWTNTDAAAHGIVFDKNASYSNLENFTTDEPLVSGETISFPFEQVGTFTYKEKENPAYTGTVVVE